MQTIYILFNLTKEYIAITFFDVIIYVAIIGTYALVKFVDLKKLGANYSNGQIGVYLKNWVQEGVSM